MAFTFDETKVETLIEQLPTASRAAFAAAAAERMALAYEKYSKRTGLGDPGLFKELLMRHWTDLGGERMSNAEIDANMCPRSRARCIESPTGTG